MKHIACNVAQLAAAKVRSEQEAQLPRRTAWQLRMSI